FDTQPAEDAAQVVDLVDAAVPLARGVALLLGVVTALHVDRVRRASPGAQLAADALLQPVRMPVQVVPAVVAGRGGPHLVRVLVGEALLEHLTEGQPEALQRVKHHYPPCRSVRGCRWCVPASRRRRRYRRRPDHRRRPAPPAAATAAPPGPSAGSGTPAARRRPVAPAPAGVSAAARTRRSAGPPRPGYRSTPAAC